MIDKKVWLFSIATAALTFAASTAYAGDMDIRVGHTAAGQLKVGGYDFGQILPLSPTSGIINGWSGVLPGFASLNIADPPNDWFPLQAGAEIWFRVNSLNPAFRVIGPGLQILDEPDEETMLGGSSFDRHVTWHINSDSAQFNTFDCIWEGTFIVRDLGSTNYSDSDPFTLRFTNLTVAQLNTDCNGNGFPDICDIGNGTSVDTNGDGIPDVCQCLQPDCGDGNVCTDDRFDSVGMMCVHDPIAALQFSDVDYNGVLDVDDIVCILNGFVGDFCCPFERLDLAPCGGNSLIDVDDILYELDAFVGVAACPDPCPP